jgi:hypothetical protein
MTPTFHAHKNTDIITYKVTDLTKNLNPSMLPKFRQLENMRFRGHQRAYNHICETFGSAFFSCIEIYINGERSNYWNLKL